MHRAEVVAIDDEDVLALPVEPIDQARHVGRVDAGTPAFGYAVDHVGSNHLTTLRYRLSDLPVDAADTSFDIGGRTFPRWLVHHPRHARDGRPGPRAIEALGLSAAPLGQRPEVATHAVDLPRLAIFSTWGDTQDVGWVRHAFDQFEIPFDLIFKEQVRAGSLRQTYDVILIPNQGRTAKGLVFDVVAAGRTAPVHEDRPLPVPG